MDFVSRVTIMKDKILTLSLLAALVSGSLAASPAMAQGRVREGGARFQFEPNKWAPHQARRSYIPPSTTSVRSGSVPSAQNLLGISAGRPLKPVRPTPTVAPAVQTSVSPTLFAGQPTPNMVPRSRPQGMKAQPYKNEFGQPPIIAQQPAQHAVPNQLPASPTVSAKKGVNATIKRHPRAKTSVNARLVKKPTPAKGMAAKPAIASYGSSHYSSGPYVPAKTSASLTTSQKVSGKLIRQH